jgi:hypothetical protein
VTAKGAAADGSADAEAAPRASRRRRRTRGGRDVPAAEAGQESATAPESVQQAS